MPDQFQFSVPTTDNTSLNFSVAAGDVLYILGANGAGKSSLLSKFFNQYSQNAKRISAHRQTWFESNTPTITARDRINVEANIRSNDVQPRARHWEWSPEARTNMVIFDLVAAETKQDHEIAALVRAGDGNAAVTKAAEPSPIQTINELMRLSNIPIEISLGDGQEIFAQRNGGGRYSVAALSDGERNAFLIAAAVLTVPSGTLILIDEPERHLHRAIISPLLNLLFGKRRDCAFIISTHEITLAMDTPIASTLLLRSCEYANGDVRSWTADLLASGTPVDESLKRDILGARRKMLFVEGTARSLDVPLYSLLFPGISVIPKETCRDVEFAVRGLRSATDTHWASVWGIVDNDQRSSEDVVRLRTAGVWALPYYSVESCYYHSTIVARVAARQVEVTGGDGAALMKAAIASGIMGVKAQKDHLVMSTVLRAARRKILNNLPNLKSIEDGVPVKFEVDVAALRTGEGNRFDSLINAEDWDGLLVRYPVRESAGFANVVSTLGMTDRALYRAAVLKLLQDEPEAIVGLRALLGDLCSDIDAR